MSISKKAWTFPERPYYYKLSFPKINRKPNNSKTEERKGHTGPWGQPRGEELPCRLLSCPGGSQHRMFKILCFLILKSFPGGSDGKKSACSAGDLGLIARSRRSPGEGNGNPLYYSCLENSLDRGAWWAIYHGVTKSQTQLSS